MIATLVSCSEATIRIGTLANQHAYDGRMSQAVWRRLGVAPADALGDVMKQDLGMDDPIRRHACMFWIYGMSLVDT